MVFSCFAVYVLANNTRIVPYFYRCVWPPRATIHDSKCGTTCVLFASTYTAKKHVLFSKWWYSTMLTFVLMFNAILICQTIAAQKVFIDNYPCFFMEMSFQLWNKLKKHINLMEIIINRNICKTLWYWNIFEFARLFLNYTIVKLKDRKVKNIVQEFVCILDSVRRALCSA